jgi:NAD(P)-dependent dehydrogenase (short-subunit alcohol dehydrogenase family)
MLLQNKNAIIYGAGGSLGGTVARALAKAGAKVFVTASDMAGKITGCTIDVTCGTTSALNYKVTPIAFIS